MSHINFYVCLDLLVIENSNHSVLIVAWLRSWSLDTCQSYQARFFSLWIETIKCFRLVLFCSNLVHKWSNETNIHKIQNSVSFTLCAEYKKNPINTDQNPHIVNSSQLVLFEEEKMTCVFNTEHWTMSKTNIILLSGRAAFFNCTAIMVFVWKEA